MANDKFSYAQTPKQGPYLYCTIPEKLREHAATTPDKVAFVIYSTTWERDVLTCKDLYEQCQAFARSLVLHGIGKGDTVAMDFPNSREWLICTFGIQMSGAVPLHMTYKYKDGRDILPILQSLGNCKAIFMNDCNNSFMQNIVDGYRKEGDMSVLNSSCLPSLEILVLKNLKTNSKMTMSFTEFLEKGNKEVKLPSLDPDDLAGLVLTSGSTGLPKIVPKSHFQFLDFGKGFIAGYDAKANDVFFNDRLFNWGAGYPTVFIVSGITHVTSRDHFALGSVKEVCEFAVKIIKTENCTVSQFLPAFVQEMLSLEAIDIDQRLIVSSGVPIPRNCSNVVGRFSDKFCSSYGCTELGFVSAKTVTSPTDFSSYCIGRPLPGFEMKVVDSDGNIVAKNQEGELFVRHMLAFSGYLNNHDKTKEVLHSSGWYKTDDVAYMNENGDFFVTGRRSDAFLCYGELISPIVLENEIKQHPEVSEVCVVPISDPICFQKVCACIVFSKGSALTVEGVVEFLSTDKASNKMKYKDSSRIFLKFENLPKTAVGKIFRKGAQEEALKRLK